MEGLATEICRDMRLHHFLAGFCCCEGCTARTTTGCGVCAGITCFVLSLRGLYVGWVGRRAMQRHALAPLFWVLLLLGWCFHPYELLGTPWYVRRRRRTCNMAFCCTGRCCRNMRLHHCLEFLLYSDDDEPTACMLFFCTEGHTHTRIHTHKHIHNHIHIHTNILHTHTHVHIHTYTHAHIHIHTYDDGYGDDDGEDDDDDDDNGDR